ncbi:MAG: biotin transporter BioY [Cyanobacteria bacterium P01_E01_bin.6]
MSKPLELLWAFIGLILTVGGTFIEAFIAGIPLEWADPRSLGVSWQIGAMLFVGCMGGRHAAAISQIAYIFLGLTWFPIFTYGGGIRYIFEPTFGYLLGFVPGAWVCGVLALQFPKRLELLALSCLCGLFTVHLTGISYLVVNHFIDNENTRGLSALLSNLFNYSVAPVPGQLVIVCAVSLVAYILRSIMFY